ncbi:energy transducer TonB [Parasedimentitalea marina]|uniref:Energy transducer TonB n=1 Tax=Parasedimentitalea marina TaxID=2483033 RepID=A0A3T0MZI2_9RHOB|nr:energy transducer TonB [Parasedimentitalea marina]AZV77180.1 energy transducer TonB [Parasedimentitalea marina]
MQTGTKISLTAHVGLMGWVVFGAWFPSEPLPFQVQEVTMISTAEFALLNQQHTAPIIAEEPAVLPVPQDDTPVPEVAPVSDVEPEAVVPEPIAPPAPDPEVAERPEPEPAPLPIAPAPVVPSLPDIAPELPQTAEPQVAQPADRVAPVPIAPPAPDTAVDEVVQPEVAPDEGSETQQEVQEATAPEAANDRIVTEAEEQDEQASAAPTLSLRPKTRPRRPTPPEAPVETAAADAPENQPEDQPADQPVEEPSDAVADAVAEAIAGGADVITPEPSGPPLTSGEKDALRISVSNCWNVGSLSTDALGTTVVVGVSLSQDGKPDVGSIRMLSSTGGSSTAAKQAFEAARRAIIRCGAKGFQLPPEKYGQWRDIEMTFNPERMRIK